MQECEEYLLGVGIVFQQILLGQLDTNILMNKTVSLPYTICKNI
jgi:hypothetical protein